MSTCNAGGCLDGLCQESTMLLDGNVEGRGRTGRYRPWSSSLQLFAISAVPFLLRLPGLLGALSRSFSFVAGLAPRALLVACVLNDVWAIAAEPDEADVAVEAEAPAERTPGKAKARR